MSIATDEAEKKYILPNHHGTPAFDLYWLKDQQQHSYVAGRTAEPTEAETKAAITEWDRHGYCHRVGDPIVCMCGARLTDGKAYDVHLVRATLEAARQAVAE